MKLLKLKRFICKIGIHGPILNPNGWHPVCEWCKKEMCV